MLQKIKFMSDLFCVHLFLLALILLCKHFVKSSCSFVFCRYILDNVLASFCLTLDLINNFNKFVLLLRLVVTVPER